MASGMSIGNKIHQHQQCTTNVVNNHNKNRTGTCNNRAGTGSGIRTGPGTTSDFAIPNYVPPVNSNYCTITPIRKIQKKEKLNFIENFQNFQDFSKSETHLPKRIQITRPENKSRAITPSPIRSRNSQPHQGLERERERPLLTSIASSLQTSMTSMSSLQSSDIVDIDEHDEQQISQKDWDRKKLKSKRDRRKTINSNMLTNLLSATVKKVSNSARRSSGFGLEKIRSLQGASPGQKTEKFERRLSLGFGGPRQKIASAQVQSAACQLPQVSKTGFHGLSSPKIKRATAQSHSQGISLSSAHSVKSVEMTPDRIIKYTNRTNNNKNSTKTQILETKTNLNEKFERETRKKEEEKEQKESENIKFQNNKLFFGRKAEKPAQNSQNFQAPASTTHDLVLNKFLDIDTYISEEPGLYNNSNERKSRNERQSKLEKLINKENKENMERTAKDITMANKQTPGDESGLETDFDRKVSVSSDSAKSRGSKGPFIQIEGKCFENFDLLVVLLGNIFFIFLRTFATRCT